MREYGVITASMEQIKPGKRWKMPDEVVLLFVNNSLL